jgi:hypothetical protein
MSYTNQARLTRISRLLGFSAIALALLALTRAPAALVGGLFLYELGTRSQAAAQSPAKPQESLETLTTDANDPTALLAQSKIENDYTVDEYGTEAEPNSIQIQPVIPIRLYSLWTRFIGIPRVPTSIAVTEEEKMSFGHVFRISERLGDYRLRRLPPPASPHVGTTP